MTNEQWVRNMPTEELLDFLCGAVPITREVVKDNMFYFLYGMKYNYPEIDFDYRTPFSADWPISQPQAIKDVDVKKLAMTYWLSRERSENA